jgi:hypothetical protein
MRKIYDLSLRIAGKMQNIPKESETGAGAAVY